MASVFPTAIDAFVNPQPTDQVDVVPHAQQHANANDAIVAIETYLKNGSATGPTQTVTITGPGAASGDTTLENNATSAVVRVERNGEVQYVTVSPTNTPVTVTIGGETLTLTWNDGPPPFISYSTTGGARDLGVTGFDGAAPGGGGSSANATFTGDGANMTRPLPSTPASGTLHIFNESGQRLFDPLHYGITGNVVTLTSAPALNEKLYAFWFVSVSSPVVSDTAYGPSRDGQTTVAPSMNAVYDKISTLGGPTGYENAGRVLFVSPVVVSPSNPQTITHNLNVLESDVLQGRYSIESTYSGDSGATGFTYFETNNGKVSEHVWTTSNPSEGRASRQANTLKVSLSSSISTPSNLRVIIKQNR